MPYRLAADAVVLLHLAFILTVGLGWALVLRWPRLLWVQVPVVAWGVAISIGQWVCPLTPLENALRRSAGASGYEGSFIDHYLLPVIYPEGLTPAAGLVIAALVAVVNLATWGWMWAHRAGKGGRNTL